MITSLEKTTFEELALNHVERENRARLSKIYEVSKKGSVSRLTEVLEKIIQMTHKTLSAEEASILLFRGSEQELYFETASGPLSRTLRHEKLDSPYGIAGQVARTFKPLIVNDVARSEKFHKMIDDTMGFVTRSLICAPLAIDHKIIGVIEVLNKQDDKKFDQNDLDAVMSVAATAAMSIDNTILHQTVLDAYKNTIRTLATAIDTKDPFTRGHSQRVLEYTMLAAPYCSFSSEEMEHLEYACILHDIGKIAIDSQILTKPEPLSPSEWKIIREHPAYGADMLREVPFLVKASELVLSHHERLDGKGYPNGLKGEDIPLGSRLIAVADAFDSMTTNRAYRPARTFDDAVKELLRCSGTQFCPVAVKAFMSGLRLNDLSDK